ncbi:MAG: ATP-binding protein [Candidatus Anammoxibacter sp.]
MAFTIAFSGKGGTGKSTIAALSVRYLTEELKKTVLAVDADPNSCLGMELGINVESTISDVREDVIKKKMDFPPGMSKEMYVDYCIEESIIEKDGYDLLTMGRPEGPKCYCYINNLLRKYLDKAASSYPYVVIDNEAGMEHLSRRTTNDVDILFIVAEPTMAGIKTIDNIKIITDELPINIKRKAIILNRIHNGKINDKIKKKIDESGIEVVAQLPFDDEIIELSSDSKSMSFLSKENGIFKTIGKMIDECINSA